MGCVDRIEDGRMGQLLLQAMSCTASLWHDFQGNAETDEGTTQDQEAVSGPGPNDGPLQE